MASMVRTALLCWSDVRRRLATTARLPRLGRSFRLVTRTSAWWPSCFFSDIFLFILFVFLPLLFFGRLFCAAIVSASFFVVLSLSISLSSSSRINLHCQKASIICIITNGWGSNFAKSQIIEKGSVTSLKNTSVLHPATRGEGVILYREGRKQNPPRGPILLLGGLSESRIFFCVLLSFYMNNHTRQGRQCVFEMQEETKANKRVYIKIILY